MCSGPVLDRRDERSVERIEHYLNQRWYVRTHTTRRNVPHKRDGGLRGGTGAHVEREWESRHRYARDEHLHALLQVRVLLQTLGGVSTSWELFFCSSCSKNCGQQRCGCYVESRCAMLLHKNFIQKEQPCVLRTSLLDLVLAIAKLAEDALTDYYAILSVSPTSTSAEIKQAYHQALLVHHPDKQQSQHGTGGEGIIFGKGVDVALLQRAYQILTSPTDRAAYDASRAEAGTKRGPRPAQIISLEDFEEVDSDIGQTTWTYSCRCGGAYIVMEKELEDGQHLVGCNSCSEAVWVGYEVVEDVEDDAQ
ncbi:hypothetical protein DAEQUDRAFT_562002 [Daedalea quercina L-15889]|uniref:Diphthamide biosynthesis protein 4 n=1 Tax=Daedalea quercina L-15889 TaxID=1314783 RepID=A0A165LYT0_9APHY|nr:hypothetical protein DAEQUDRAFT_562002 [Daedalea quercina L-15889]